MSEPIQGAIPGTDVPSAPAKRPRGRPRGPSNKGALFADGGGDFRLYLVSPTDGSLSAIQEQPGFFDALTATRWLRAHGGRDDLLGQTVIVMRGIAIVKIEMAPSLLFKPRAKPPEKPRRERPAPAPEPVAAT